MFRYKAPEKRYYPCYAVTQTKTGTLYMSNGCTAPASRPTRRSWKRTANLHLTLAQLENNWAALGHSARIGLLPNETFDIHFHKGGIADPHNQARISLQEFLKSARQWVERKGEQTAFIWVLENRGDGGGHGIHAHVLFHLPPKLAVRFHQLKPRWARKAGLDMAVAKVMNRERMPTLNSAKGKMQYISKDLDPKHWPIFKDPTGRVHLDDRGKPSDQPIYGKKCGISRNIDAKARNSHRAQQTA